MFYRRPLMFLLSLGVIFGYGGAIASARWHARHHDCGDRWSEQARFDDRLGYRHLDPRNDFDAPRPAPVAAAQPQTVVVQPAAAPAAAPQIFFIMPGATAPQAVTQVAVPAAAVAPVAASPAPAAP